MSFSEIARLTFEEPDLETFPLLKLAYDALKADDGSTIVLNAANEIAVEAFLEGRIGFTDIYKTVKDMLMISSSMSPESVNDIIEMDRKIRLKALDMIKSV